MSHRRGQKQQQPAPFAPRCRKAGPYTLHFPSMPTEDDALVRMDSADQLADEGLRVFEAANPTKLWHYYFRPTPRFASSLPTSICRAMDGLKLASAVRDRRPLVKIIVTSGHRLVEMTDVPDGSVSKPYRYDAVMIAVGQMRECQTQVRESLFLALSGRPTIVTALK